jgi:putative oxidoreductase
MEDSYPHDLFSPILKSSALMGPFLLTARLFTTGIFVFYLVNEIMRVHGPNGLLYAAIAVQLAGVVLIALGYQTRCAALMLAVYIVVSLVFRANAGLFIGFQVTMLKDLAIAAGFLFMFAYGPGPISIDERLTGRGRDGAGHDSSGSFFSAILRNNLIMGPLLLVARVISTFVFFVYGTHKFMNTPGTRVYMITHNPHVPTDLVYLAIVTQFIFPTLVFLGYKTRYGALALAGFCLIATSLFHTQFGIHSEVEQFVLDFAITGGFLFMFSYGPGPLSVDAWLGRARPAGKTSPSIEKGDVSLAG